MGFDHKGAMLEYLISSVNALLIIPSEEICTLTVCRRK